MSGCLLLGILPYLPPVSGREECSTCVQRTEIRKASAHLMITANSLPPPECEKSVVMVLSRFGPAQPGKLVSYIEVFFLAGLAELVLCYSFILTAGEISLRIGAE